ncbi:helix-turn-helix domain-containing protein [Paenibacillus glucanolyticus]|uniref:helix-turn-helix domain-containing protein n=1 Tax=Paenibacillus glucanolyticus TaxID=59843 RepID=UPI0034CF1A51
MKIENPSEQAMNNLYYFLNKVLPKYLDDKDYIRGDNETEGNEPGQKAEGILSRVELPNNLTPKNIHQFTNINLRTVYDLMNKSLDHGGIPAFRIGKSLYSDREEFLKWWDETKERGRK